MYLYLALAASILLAWTVVSRFRSATRKQSSRRRAAVVLFSYFPEDPRPRREAEALARNGFEVDVFCLRRDCTERLHTRFGGTEVFRLHLRRRRASKLTYIFQYSWFLIASFAFLSIRSWKGYRIVHVHNMPDFLVFSAIVPRLLGAKVILDLHDPVPELFQVIYGLSKDSIAVRALKILEKWSVGFAHKVLTPNLAFKELFVARGCPESKILIVMNSPDEALFGGHVPEVRPELDGFNLMFHGTLLERNGLHLAVEAMAIICRGRPGVNLHIHGEPTPYIREVIQKADQFSIAGNVHYHGYKPLSEIPSAITTCNVGIIPNLANAFNNINFPTRIFEYLSMGKLPIVPRTRGILDYFHEDDLCFFQPGDAGDLAAKIEWAYLNPEAVKQKIQRALKVYTAHRWTNEQDSFLAAVQQLTEAPCRPEGEKAPGICDSGRSSKGIEFSKPERGHCAGNATTGLREALYRSRTF
jgi:glycosyltransferase involved in cell wall biosynthesis